MTEPSGRVSTGTARRELTAAVLGSALAGAVALSAGGQAWAQVTADRPAPLPPVTATMSGAEAAPLVPAGGLVLLAAAVALLAVRGAARVAVGLLVAVAGGTLVWSGLRALTGGLDDAPTEVAGAGRVPGPVTLDVAAVWPVLAIVAGVLAVTVGVLVVARGRGWPAMGRRYERTPATAPARTDEDRAQAAWRALDRGDDPTEDPTDDRTDPASGERPV